MVRIAVQVASLAILVRLLSPAAFGYVAMVTAIVGIAELIREFGLSKAAVQAPVLTRAQRDNLFWLNAGLGLALSVLVLAVAPLVAALYGEPLLEPVTRCLAVVFLLNGFGAQFRASLQRDLRFTALAVLETLGPAAGLAAAVAVALQGGSYWALVAQQVVTTAVVAVGPACVAGWWPGRPRRSASIRPMLGYGGSLFGTQALTYVGNNVDTVVIGLTAGPAAAGLYNRVYQLVKLPVSQLNAPITRVALPVLARIQDDPPRYARYLRQGQLVLLNVLVPALALGWAVAGPLVHLVLGDAWGQAVPIFSLLVVGGVFQAIGFVQNWVFLSSGKTGQQFRLNLLTRPAFVVAVLVGSLWGVTGVAAGYALTAVLQWPVALWWAGRAVPEAQAGRLAVTALRAVATYSAAAVVAHLAVRAAGLDDAWLSAGLGAGVMLAVLAAGAAVLPAYRRDLAGCVTAVRVLRGAGARSGRGDRANERK
ncbi:lipopolysaccharide biosynthesis protein [Myceligenerans crystallogenes]|uniref:Lipopolysaccharide biosynthesis protein n=2 Tax=Myceligenerans crystallogenes TaxID=316335 RepID=A0ABN2NA60_9MICO